LNKKKYIYIYIYAISESDFDEFLQIHSVFNNVSKGLTAKQADLVKAFKTDDIEKIILEVIFLFK